MKHPFDLPSLPPYIIGASVAGPLHVQTGLPCQDACRFGVLPGGFGVIAVADGLGSAPMSDLGARVSVEAAVSLAERVFGQNTPKHTDLTSLSRRMMYAARDSLEETALREGQPLNSFATTLITAVFLRDRIAVAQIGDGGSVARIGGALTLLSSPGSSEYANEVTPLTSENWIEELFVSGEYAGTECVAVFTDGCQRSALSRTAGSYEPFDRFFNPVFSFALSVRDSAQATEELIEFLSSKKVSEHSEDDKTLVVAVL